MTDQQQQSVQDQIISGTNLSYAEEVDLSSINTINTSSSASQDTVNPVPIHSTTSAPQEVERTQTNTSSLSNKNLRRPRKERRGLLCNLSLIPEFKDARDYPDKLKWIIVFIIAFGSMIGPMGTSIVFPAIENMKEDFHTTTMMINVSVGIYLLSLGIFPIWWSSFSEKFGRRSIYIVSFCMYLGFAIGCSLSPSINALIGFRILSGGCSASVQSVGAGTISDLFVPERRGRALGYFYLGALASPLVSPIVGSLLLLRWNWRSTQWFLVIFAGFITMCIIFLLPETLRLQDNKAFIAGVLRERRIRREKNDEESHSQDDGDTEENQIERVASRVSARTNPTFDATNNDVHSEVFGTSTFHDSRTPGVFESDLRKKITKIENELDAPLTKLQSFKRNFYEYVIKPTKAVYFLQYPPVALAVTFSAVSFGILYLVNTTIEYEYARAPYNWRPLFVGLAYIPNSTTYIFASIYGGRWTDNLYKKFKEKNGFNAPESRISYNILSAVISFPIALMIIGWCFNYHKHWVTPLVGTAIFGYASMMTIGCTVTYLVDTLPGRGATGVAINNLIRQMCATIAVFISDPMIKSINTGPTYSIFTGVIIIASLVLVVLKKRGSYWRENYDLQKLYDKLD